MGPTPRSPTVFPSSSTYLTTSDPTSWLCRASLSVHSSSSSSPSLERKWPTRRTNHRQIGLSPKQPILLNFSTSACVSGSRLLSTHGYSSALVVDFSILRSRLVRTDEIALTILWQEKHRCSAARGMRLATNCGRPYRSMSCWSCSLHQGFPRFLLPNTWRNCSCWCRGCPVSRPLECQDSLATRNIDCAGSFYRDVPYCPIGLHHIYVGSGEAQGDFHRSRGDWIIVVHRRIVR